MKTTDSGLIKIAKIAYPTYTGRKFFVEIWNGKPIDCTSFWCDGSRDYFVFVRLDGKTLILPESAPWIQSKENRMAKLSPGLFCVRHRFSCGHDCGLTVIMAPEKIQQIA